MATQASIKTIRDPSTGEAIAPRTLVKALSGDGKGGQLVGYTADGVVGAVDPPEGGVTSFNGREGAVTAQAGDYTAEQVGLGNVDNTSDLDKPVSTAQQAALAGKADLVEGKVLSSQLPKMNYDPAGSAAAALEAAKTDATTKAYQAESNAKTASRPSTWTPTAQEVGAVPTGRKVNGHALTGDVTLTAKDVGAELLAASGTTAGTATALTLAQDGFSLQDGAVVRIKLHTDLQGGATLNVAGTGAKPILTATGDHAEGFPAGTWLEAVYSTATGAYIVSGGGSGAEIGLNFNLLEEIDKMKYCEVLTNEYTGGSAQDGFLAQAPFRCFCPSANGNYTYFARILESGSRLELRVVNQSTGKYEDYFTEIGFTPLSGASGESSEYINILYPIQVRGTDDMVFDFYCRNTSGSNNIINLGAFLFRKESGVFVKIRGFSTANTIYFSKKVERLGMSNAVKTDKGVFVVLPHANESDNAYGGYTVYAIDDNNTVSTGKQQTSSANYSEYRYYMFVFSDATAIEVTGRDYDSTGFTSGELESNGTWKLNSASSFYATGDASKYSWCISTSYYNQTNVKIDDKQKTITLTGMTAREAVTGKNAYPTLTTIGPYEFKSNVNPEITSSRPFGFTSDQLNKGVYFLPPGTMNKNFAFALTTRSKSPKSGKMIMEDTGDKASYLLPLAGVYGYAATNGGVVCDNVFYAWDSHGRTAVIDLNNPDFQRDGEREWTCPEAGVYKVITVGGGAAGETTHAGGAGYLKVGTKRYTKGQKVKYRVGNGQILYDTGIPEVIGEHGIAKETYFDDIIALPATGNQGGALGAATSSGGGAGGYDLVTYGGQGMNYVTPTTINASTTAGTIQPTVLAKDRNGGTSANAGAVTSGSGYGAGGGANQDGKDGVIVIMR